MFGFIKSSFCGFINHKTPLSSNSGHVTQPCISVEDRMVGVERNQPRSTTKKRRRERKEAKTPSKISFYAAGGAKWTRFLAMNPGSGCQKVPLIIKPRYQDNQRLMQGWTSFRRFTLCRLQQQLLWQLRTGVRRLNESCKEHLSE